MSIDVAKWTAFYNTAAAEASLLGTAIAEAASQGVTLSKQPHLYKEFEFLSEKIKKLKSDLMGLEGSM